MDSRVLGYFGRHPGATQSDSWRSTAGATRRSWPGWSRACASAAALRRRGRRERPPQPAPVAHARRAVGAACAAAAGPAAQRQGVAGLSTARARAAGGAAATGAKQPRSHRAGRATPVTKRVAPTREPAGLPQMIGRSVSDTSRSTGSSCSTIRSSGNIWRWTVTLSAYWQRPCGPQRHRQPAQADVAVLVDVRVGEPAGRQPALAEQRRLHDREAGEAGEIVLRDPCPAPHRRRSIAPQSPATPHARAPARPGGSRSSAPAAHCCATGTPPRARPACRR